MKPSPRLELAVVVEAKAVVAAEVMAAEVVVVEANQITRHLNLMKITKESSMGSLTPTTQQLSGGRKINLPKPQI